MKEIAAIKKSSRRRLNSKEIVVLGCIEAEGFECGTPWGCISIATKEDEFIRLHKRNRKALLQIAFADMCEACPGFDLFDTSQAHDILDFVTHHWKKIGTLMIHCEAGLSRSPAVAAAIARLKLGDESELFEHPFIPNRHVYRTLLEEASGRGDFQDGLYER